MRRIPPTCVEVLLFLFFVLFAVILDCCHHRDHHREEVVGCCQLCWNESISPFVLPWGVVVGEWFRYRQLDLPA